MPVQIHIAPLTQLTPETLYRVLQLRTDVFIVEQACAYPELDGRDLENDCLIMWAADGAEVVGTLRILRDPESLRIGRVAVRQQARGSGVARELFTRALTECGALAADLPIVLDAQEPLEGWYGSFGFTRDSETFMEDGIPHVTMRRLPEQQAGS